MDEKQKIIDQLKEGLIVSCQATPDEPHYMEGITTMMARCAFWAGAVAIRANTPNDVKSIAGAVPLPVIGLWKIGRGEKKVYLTPTIEAAKALYATGAKIIAAQATSHIRDDGKPAYEIIREIKREIPEALIFADVSNAEDAKIAAKYGADFIAPTLYGYGNNPKDILETTHNYGPDWELLSSIIKAVKGTDSLVIMEGKINTPEQAVQCLYMGAYAVVVGNAITRPHMAASRFVDAINRYE
ncbi:MAG: putative N-acetylmannosamine-6-phosphate 2-epimerase [Herbinix sp.]|nr:putative N-acetylmannosamine-6-phosphate 2-epimerase [Herbinix sp.]